jgi:hypothetical protein
LAQDEWLIGTNSDTAKLYLLGPVMDGTLLWKEHSHHTPSLPNKMCGSAKTCSTFWLNWGGGDQGVAKNCDARRFALQRWIISHIEM